MTPVWWRCGSAPRVPEVSHDGIADNDDLMKLFIEVASLVARR